jgi:hypothetical protein
MELTGELVHAPAVAGLRAWLRDWAKSHPRRGFRPAYHDARADGWQVNHYPAVLRCDIGPELTCAAMVDRAGEHTGLHFIPPGQPWRNGYIESFNSRWNEDDNHRRRHSALGYQGPAVYAAACNHPMNDRCLDPHTVARFVGQVFVSKRLEPVGRLVRHPRHVFSRAWPFRTAGGRWAGRPGSLPPSGWTAIPPGRALCPGRCRGTAACPGR